MELNHFENFLVALHKLYITCNQQFLSHDYPKIIDVNKKQAGADITGQLQIRPMLYTLYIGINLRVVKMLHTDNKQQITKWIQSPSKRRSYVTPGGALQFRPMVYTLH